MIFRQIIYAMSARFRYIDMRYFAETSSSSHYHFITITFTPSTSLSLNMTFLIGIVICHFNIITIFAGVTAPFRFSPHYCYYHYLRHIARVISRSHLRWRRQRETLPTYSFTLAFFFFSRGCHCRLHYCRYYAMLPRLRATLLLFQRLFMPMHCASLSRHFSDYWLSMAITFIISLLFLFITDYHLRLSFRHYAPPLLRCRSDTTLRAYAAYREWCRRQRGYADITPFSLFHYRYCRFLVSRELPLFAVIISRVYHLYHHYYAPCSSHFMLRHHLHITRFRHCCLLYIWHYHYSFFLCRRFILHGAALFSPCFTLSSPISSHYHFFQYWCRLLLVIRCRHSIRCSPYADIRRFADKVNMRAHHWYYVMPHLIVYLRRLLTIFSLFMPILRYDAITEQMTLISMIFLLSFFTPFSFIISSFSFRRMLSFFAFLLSFSSILIIFIAFRLIHMLPAAIFALRSCHFALCSYAFVCAMMMRHFLRHFLHLLFSFDYLRLRCWFLYWHFDYATLIFSAFAFVCYIEACW